MMINLNQIAGFDWDDGNDRKNVEKHAVNQIEAEQVFLDPRLLVLVDEKHSGAEKRFQAYGEVANGRRLQVSFTLRQNETMIRVISARDMSRRERARYEQEA
ncbi:MAG: uncharacterized protein QOF19_1718 [Alphaproteobacteria bacterium]|jgi:uncharacterized DUF497 family protein|nr:uncharacterized protein [Alphaproteobacteria bacterium]